MKKVFAWMFIAVIVVSCSSKEPDREVTALVPKPLPAPPAPKPVVRTLGSLWSSDSRWNEMYAIPVARSSGDTVHVQLADALKARIIARIPVDLEKQKEAEKEQARREDPNRDVQGHRTFIHEDGRAAKVGDSKSFDVLIREVLPRGVYNVYASELMTLNGKQVLVTLDGNVREQDVGAGNTIGSDLLFNTKIQVETQAEKK